MRSKWFFSLPIVLLQIESEIGYFPEHKTSSEAQNHACALMSFYNQCQHLYENVDEKDRGPADELPALAVTALVRTWRLDPAKDPTPLIQVSRSKYRSVLITAARRSTVKLL